MARDNEDDKTRCGLAEVKLRINVSCSGVEIERRRAMIRNRGDHKNLDY